MAIAPIGGLSTYSPISSIQPMNYSVQNEADVSDVYATEVTKNTAGVNGANPVQYPNAMVSDDDSSSMTVDPLERQRKNIQVSSRFNDIASQFSTNKTSYNMSGIGASYSMAGSRFDVYA